MAAPILLAALGTMAICGCNGDESGTGSQTAADAAKLRSSFLEKYELTGRVALIEFGLVGCELSDKGLVEMAFLATTEAIEGLAFARIEVSADDGAVAKYYESKSLTFPVHRDPERTLAEAFAATNDPSFVLVDKFGRVRYRGNWPKEHLQEWAQALLAEQADPGPAVAMLGQVKRDGPTLVAETALPDLSGEVRALDGLLGDNGLLLLFVDTTCPYSVQAMGDMPTVARALAMQKIRSVTVNIDGSEQDVRDKFGSGVPGVPMLYDETSMTKDAWNVQSVPTVAYVTPDKQVGYYGAALWSDVAAAIEAAGALKPGTIRFTAKGTKYG